ncbi:MAG: ATP-binding protein [Myxococcota bacterium]|nr:ATP-binding protein [Myxococcota bacterium]
MNSVIYFLAALCSAIFALQIQQHKRPLFATRSYIFLCILSSIAFFSFAIHLLYGQIWLRNLFYCTVAFIGPSLLLFLHNWDRRKEFPHSIWYGGSITTGIFLALEIWPNPPSSTISLSELLISCWFLGSTFICGKYLWKEMKNASEDPIRYRRLRHLLILFGLAVVTLGLESLLRALIENKGSDALDFRTRSRILQGVAPPMGAVLSVLFLYVLHLNVQLTRLVGVYELFSRLSATALSSLILTLLIGITFYLGSGSTLHFSFHLLLVVLLFLSIFPIMRKPIKRISTQFFNRYGSQLYTALNDIEEKMPQMITIEKLDRLLLSRIHEAGRSRITSLYLWEHEKGVFSLKKVYGDPPSKPIETVSRDRFTEIFQIGKVLRKDELSTESNPFGVHILEQMHTEMCFPLWSDKVVAGWINLSPDPWSGGFSRDEIRALQRVVNLAANSLETIRSIEKLKEQHRLAALGTMSAGLAHEIRNPLSGIKGAAQFLQDHPEAEELETFLQLIVSEADRLNVVVSQFLNYARPLQLQTEEGDLNRVIQRVVDMERSNPKNDQIQYLMHLSSELSPFYFDPNLIHQVLLNLLQNSAQAMNGDGNITISSRLCFHVDPPYRGQPAAEFSIKDEGPGISREAMDKLFIPFFTTKNDGTGLGLAISRRLIEVHNGTITVASQIGKGTRFVIRLPILLPSGKSNIPA